MRETQRKTILILVVSLIFMCILPVETSATVKKLSQKQQEAYEKTLKNVPSDVPFGDFSDWAELYFALVDVDGDGIRELLTHWEDTRYDEKTPAKIKTTLWMAGLYAYKNGKVVKVLTTVPASYLGASGDGSWSICPTKHMIVFFGHEFVGCNSWNYYKYAKGKVSQKCSEVLYTEPLFMQRDDGSMEYLDCIKYFCDGKEISKEKFQKHFEKYGDDKKYTFYRCTKKNIKKYLK